MNSRRRKVIFLQPANIGPYHVARFSRLAKVYPGLHVGGITILEVDHPWYAENGDLGFRFTIFGKDSQRKNHRQQVQAVVKFLRKENPEALIVAGYTDPALRAPCRWAKKAGVACILLSDSWENVRPRYWLKEKIKKYFLIKPLYDAAYVSGYLSFQYHNSLGISADAIWRGMDVVDNDHFSQKAAEAGHAKKVWQTKYGLPDDYFLTVARLSSEKNLIRLLQAFAEYREFGGLWHLVIVGRGPQEEELKRLAQSLAGDKVLFLGWRAYEELPVFYGLAKCFVFASLVNETWGLVINEAMACGLPVLVSRKCGCYPELCHRGINGFDFDPLDVGGLARLLLRVSGGEVELEAMGEASRRIIANYSLQTWVQSLKDCIETTWERGQQRRNLVK
jgi:1,2-diacylglycerol 3-alpha-glucosyltransferase